MLLVLGVALGLLLWWAWEKSHRRAHPVPAGLQPDITLSHEQEFELYHNALSLCSMKARVCMAELGVPYRSHHIDLIETGSYENISRCSSTSDRRRPFIFAAFKFRRLEKLPGMTPAMKILARSRRQMGAHFDVLEEQLEKSGGPWILGEAFTLADVGFLVIFERLAQADVEHVFLGEGKRPACTAYWHALKQRPSYREAILEHGHELIAYGTDRIRKAKAADPELREALEG